MASVTQLGCLGIGVSGLARWERFATEVPGLQVSGSDSDGSMFLGMDEYHHPMRYPTGRRRRPRVHRMGGPCWHRARTLRAPNQRV